MTPREAVAKAAQQIDAILAKKLGALELQLIEDGVEFEDANAVLEHQRHLFVQWRRGALASIRPAAEYLGRPGA
jgi:hypothetical protein